MYPNNLTHFHLDNNFPLGNKFPESKIPAPTNNYTNGGGGAILPPIQKPFPANIQPLIPPLSQMSTGHTQTPISGQIQPPISGPTQPPISQQQLFPPPPPTMTNLTTTANSTGGFNLIIA